MSSVPVSKEFLDMYEDAQCTIRLEKMDFGRPYLGTQNKKIVYVHNSNKKWPITNIRLNESIKTKELQVIYPELLTPNEVAKIEIHLNPLMTREEPLYAANMLVAGFVRNSTLLGRVEIPAGGQVLI